MISRLSTFAAAFAILATATIALAASERQSFQAEPAKAVRTVQLPHVVVLAKRLP